MMLRLNWFLGMLFTMATFGTLMNPPPSVAIAFLFFLIGLILLPFIDNLIKHHCSWKINGGIKGTIVLTSLIIMCLIVPQVETNMALFTNPTANLK